MNKAIVLSSFLHFLALKLRNVSLNLWRPTRMRWDEVNCLEHQFSYSGAQGSVVRIPQAGRVIPYVGCTKLGTPLSLWVPSASFSLGTSAVHVNRNHVNTGRKSCIRLLGGFPTEIRAVAYGSKMQYDPGKEFSGASWKAMQFSVKRPWGKSRRHGF